MRFFVKKCTGCGWLAALAVGMFGIADAHAGGKGDKIQFSEPSTPVATSNPTAGVNQGVERLNPIPSGFKQVQEDLFRPLKEALPSVDSMQGVMAMPEPPVQQPQQSAHRLTRHERDLLDHERNWAFTDLNELYPEPSIEESLGLQPAGEDGNKKAATSTVQKFIDRQSAEQNKATLDRAEQRTEKPGVFKPDFTGATELKQILAVQSPGAEESFGKQLFGDSGETSSKLEFGGKSPFQALTPEQKHRDEFSHLLDPSLPATAKVSSSLIGNQDSSFYTPVSALLSQTTAVAQTAQPAQPHHSVLYPLGMKDPVEDPLHSSVFDDPTAAALGLPNPTTVKTTTEQPVTSESIQKMLDPYTANMAKRRF